MKRPVKFTLWFIGALFALMLVAPPILSATPAEPKYMCAQCHTMTAQYETYTASKHSGEITCSECHVPNGFVSGLATKYTDGARHVFATLKGTKAEEIRITSHSLETVLDNCARCHTDVEHATQKESRYCITCHADEAHGMLAEPEKGK
ncbi:MAG TPA: NapC/NirT family cytochrome c [Symbiobacteriaceae bacterium]|nr:NapC/NirT family cytochrome c [Symbiobacteriaceae bacterium]